MPIYIATLTHGAEAKKDIGRALVAWLGDKTAAKMTPACAQGIVSQWQEHYSVASQRCRLSRFRAFFSWLVKAGELRADPFAEVKVVGRDNRGKPQLRISEAQRFTAIAIQRFVDGERFALAAVVALAMGLRSSEVLGLHARDVDDGGFVLWVMHGSFAMTAKHYAQPSAVHSARTDRAGSVLFRNHSASAGSDISPSEKSNRHSIAERVL